MNKNNINFIFFGTPDVASETLQILKEAQYMPSLIVTSPDRPQGRKMVVTPPPAKTWAIENGIPYIQPERLTKENLNVALRTSVDLFLVVAYGHILSEEILNMPKLGSINIHYSLLPKYRGASPVESAVLNSDTETGVSIQQMVYKMDAGDILAQENVAIFPTETAPELRTRLIKIGGELLVKTLPEIIENRIKATPQNEKEVTHCGKIKKEDGLIDLSDDATKNYNKFRAYAHWPRTFFFKDGKRVIITDATLENGQFVIRKVLPEGKKEIAWEEYLKQN